MPADVEAFMRTASGRAGGGAKVPIAGVVGAAAVTGACSVFFLSSKIVHDGVQPSKEGLNWWMSAYERNYRNDCSRLDKNTTEMIRGETCKYDIIKRKGSFRDPSKDVYLHLNQPKENVSQE